MASSEGKRGTQRIWLSPWLPLFILFIVIMSWLTVFPVMRYWVKVDSATAGQIGDMYGAVNALFTGLALAGLFYTITLQREELGRVDIALSVKPGIS